MRQPWRIYALDILAEEGSERVFRSASNEYAYHTGGEAFESAGIGWWGAVGAMAAEGAELLSAQNQPIMKRCDLFYLFLRIKSYIFG